MSSWNYQKNRYKQITLKFFIESEEQMELYDYLKNQENTTGYIKSLIRGEMIENNAKRIKRDE